MLTKVSSFRRGYNDYREGKPLDHEGLSIGSQWQYENGRFFAIYCDVEGVDDPGWIENPTASQPATQGSLQSKPDEWKLLSFHLQQAKQLGYTR